MTFREKIAQERPEKIDPALGGGVMGCPGSYFANEASTGDATCISLKSCYICWNREIPGTEPTPAPESSPIADSGDRTQFASGAVRDLHTEEKGRMDLLPMCVLLRLARHYARGCQKYSERNWEKGIPCHSFADSALRHLVKYMDGQRDEDHLIAAIWNLCGLAWNEEKRPDLMDIPARMEGENDTEHRTAQR